MILIDLPESVWKRSQEIQSEVGHQEPCFQAFCFQSDRTRAFKTCRGTITILDMDSEQMGWIKKGATTPSQDWENRNMENNELPAPTILRLFLLFAFHYLYYFE